MPKVHKRKKPVTDHQEISQGSSSNPNSSRALIHRFHVLLKKQAQLQGPAVHNAEDAKNLAYVEREIEELGGLAAYQRMSNIGQGSDRGGGSEKVLISWLKEMGMASRGEKNKLRYATDIS